MFRPGEFQTTSDSRPVLDAMAATLRGLPPDLIILIEGHSDKGGDEAENVRLSQARAEYVLAAMVDRGVVESRMTALGLGSARPLVGDESREQYRNRRIEVFIRPAASASSLPPTAPMISLLEDDPPRFIVPLLDDQPTGFFIPLLDDGPTIVASVAPRVPLLDDDDGLMMPRFGAPTGPAPRIPLLDAGDAPRGIGLVD